MEQTLTPAQMAELVKLYIAYFNRAPEYHGLKFHVDAVLADLAAGIPFEAALVERADQFYEGGLAFPESSGYSIAMTPEEFVAVMYENVLLRPGTGGSAPTDEEIKYWTDKLATGELSRGEIATSFLRDVEILKSIGTPEEMAVADKVAAVLVNRLMVGVEFAKEENSGSLSGDAAILAGKAILNGVTDDPASAQEAIDGLDEQGGSPGDGGGDGDPGDPGGCGEDEPDPDTTAPVLTITVDKSVLTAGETATVTFTFTEVPVGFAADDIFPTGGLVSGLQATGDPRIYTATFAASADFEGMAQVAVPAGRFADAAGNQGAGAAGPAIEVEALPDETGAGITKLSPSYDAADGSGGAASFGPAISADGKIVIFSSFDSNVVPGDTNAGLDPFIWNGETGAVSGIEAGGALVGGSAEAVSGDGLSVLFYSAKALTAEDIYDGDDVYVLDRGSGAVEFVLHDATAQNFSMSHDGNRFAFDSVSAYPDGDNLGQRDVFVHDRSTGETKILSFGLDIGGTTTGNSSSPVLSGDGRYVAFTSNASNLIAGDANGVQDVFRYDLTDDSIVRVSVASDGTQGNGASSAVSMSDDGRYIVFESRADNLVAGDTNGSRDVFLHDFQAGTTIRLSMGAGGEEANDESYLPVISGDGRFVVFESAASNLVDSDVNGRRDLFLLDLQTDAVIRVAEGSTQYDEDNFNPVISDDGRFVAFQTEASLVGGDGDTQRDVYLLDGTGWWL